MGRTRPRWQPRTPIPGVWGRRLAWGVWILPVEASGDGCIVGDSDVGVGVVDGGKGVRGETVVMGGESADLLGGWFDVGVLDLLDALLLRERGEREMWTVGCQRRWGEWKGCRRRR